MVSLCSEKGRSSSISSVTCENSSNDCTWAELAVNKQGLSFYLNIHTDTQMYSSIRVQNNKVYNFVIKMTCFYVTVVSAIAQW